MSTAGDDDELTFEEIEEPKAETPKAEAGDENQPAAAAEAEAPAAEAPPAEIKNDPEAENEAAKPVETAGKKRPPLAGIFLAAVLLLCLLTSSYAAWKAGSAASALSRQAEAEHAKPRALDARLASIEKLLEEQRNMMDELSAKQVQTGGSDNAQIAALATAVRANQAMSERIPSLVASAVQARVVAARPAAASKPAAAKAAMKARSAKPAAKFQQVAARAAPPPPPPPPGDAIRYP